MAIAVEPGRRVGDRRGARDRGLLLDRPL